MTLAVTELADFDVTQPGRPLFLRVPLGDPTNQGRQVGVQGFGFDNVNKRIYTVQCFDRPNGGLWLGWINAVTGARSTEYMTLNYFDHGQQVGVQVVGSATYIWVACDPGPPNASGNGFGTKIARFQWVPGRTLDGRTDTNMTRYDFHPGSTYATLGVDSVHNRLMLGYGGSSGTWTEIYDLNDVVANGTAAKQLVPRFVPASHSGGTQGRCLFGDFSYTVTGAGKSPVCGPDTNTSFMGAQSIETHAAVWAANRTDVGIPSRESEGVAVWTQADGTSRLVFSFSTKTDCTATARWVTSFYYISEAGVEPPTTLVKSVNGYGGPLGCGTYRVMVYDRGGTDRIGEITPIQTLSWSRVRDDISLADISTAGFGPECCEMLGNLRAMRHEMVIYRDGVRVWEGPITRIAFAFDHVEIEARDVMHYLHRRILRGGYNHSYDTVNKKSRSQPVTNTIEAIIKQTLQPTFQTIPDDPHDPEEFAGGYDPNVLKYVKVYKYSDDARESRYVYPFQKTVWEEIDDLDANAGVDYTVMGRAIIVWDTSRPIGKTQVLTDDDFMANPVVTEYGMSMASFSAVTDGKGFYGVAGGYDHYYGMVEILASTFSESTAPDKSAVTTYKNLMKLQNEYYERRSAYNRYPCLSAAEEARLAAYYKERNTKGVTPERQKRLDAAIKPLATRVTGCSTLRTRMNNAKKKWNDAQKTNANYEKKITDYVKNLTSQAQRNLKGKNPSPLSVRIPENTQLNPEINLGIQDLVPGIWIPLRSGSQCRTVQQWQKLDNVTISVEGNVEQVAITVSPAPQYGADPDLDQTPPDE